MKKQSIALFMLLVTLMAAGCGTSASTAESTASEKSAAENSETASEEDTQAQTGTEEGSETESHEAARTTETSSVTEAQADEEGLLKTPDKVSEEVLSAYSSVMDAYQEAWTKKADADSLAASSLCPLLSCYYDSTETETGYLLYDLDGDGSEELIIAAGEPDGLGGQLFRILQLYTIHKGEVLSLYTGEERTPAYLIESGAAYDLYEIASSGSAETFYYQYEISGDYLYNANEIAYNEDKDPANPWFLVDGENYDPISEAAALEMIDALESSMVGLELTAF